jgi:hypothetical protein
MRNNKEGDENGEEMCAQEATHVASDLYQHIAERLGNIVNLTNRHGGE